MRQARLRFAKTLTQGGAVVAIANVVDEVLHLAFEFLALRPKAFDRIRVLGQPFAQVEALTGRRPGPCTCEATPEKTAPTCKATIEVGLDTNRPRSGRRLANQADYDNDPGGTVGCVVGNVSAGGSISALAVATSLAVVAWLPIDGLAATTTIVSRTL